MVKTKHSYFYINKYINLILINDNTLEVIQFAIHKDNVQFIKITIHIYTYLTIKGGMMASNLDKLKALSNRLEDKLLEKVDAKEKKEAPAKELKKVVTEKKVVTKKVVSKAPIEEQNFPPRIVQKKNPIREENITRIKFLYDSLHIFEKSPDFSTIFAYKAMNLSGIGLKEDDFGQLREGKYIQIIAITYEPDSKGKKRAKNISLRYFGKAETIKPELKNEIIEFVLRWRYEKAFQNVVHYENLLNKIELPIDRLF